MVAMLLGGLLVAAQVFRAGWRAGPTELERHVRAGPRVGAADLERDLRARHPAGSDVAPVVTRLSQMGFTCNPASPGATDCRYRAWRDDNRLVSVAVDLRHDGLHVQSIAVQMGLTQR